MANRMFHGLRRIFAVTFVVMGSMQTPGAAALQVSSPESGDSRASPTGTQPSKSSRPFDVGTRVKVKRMRSESARFVSTGDAGVAAAAPVTVKSEARKPRPNNAAVDEDGLKPGAMRSLALNGSESLGRQNASPAVRAAEQNALKASPKTFKAEENRSHVAANVDVDASRPAAIGKVHNGSRNMGGVKESGRQHTPSKPIPTKFLTSMLRKFVRASAAQRRALHGPADQRASAGVAQVPRKSRHPHERHPKIERASKRVLAELDEKPHNTYGAAFQSLSKTLHDLKGNLAAAEGQSRSDVAKVRVGYERRLRAQRHNTSALKDANTALGNELMDLKEHNSQLRKRADKLRRRGAALSQQLAALNGNLTLAMEFAEVSMKFDEDEKEQLAFLSSLDEKDLATQRADAHARLMSKLVLLQEAGGEPASAGDLLGSLAEELDALHQTQNESQALLVQEFEAKAAEEARRQEELIEEGAKLRREVDEQKDLEKRLRKVVSHLEKTDKELEKHLAALSSYAANLGVIFRGRKKTGQRK